MTVIEYTACYTDLKRRVIAQHGGGEEYGGSPGSVRRQREQGENGSKSLCCGFQRNGSKETMSKAQ